MTLIFDYVITNWVELLGAVLSLVYLYLSIKEKIGLWIFGFLCSTLYVIVFFSSKFYADMSLQVYYLVVSVYGWINWKKNADVKTHILPVTTISKQQYGLYIPTIFVIYLVYYIILKYFTDSPIPIMDSIVGALSVVATWMLAKKKIENWLLWIAADGIAVGLFVYKQLYPTAVLFVIYTIMAIVGYFQWKKSMER
ncbi:Nicotinamide mononucleotide transporter PnuC [uncultured Paludibacter sp.]|nr:Nicotinamide mononucleotide transporter PnuC [uncultured Paludibacter sp.]